MEIKDYINLARYTEPEQAKRASGKHPSGWEPGIKFDPETSIPTEITTPAVEKIEAGQWESILDEMQVNIPDGYEVQLVEAKYDPAAWHRDTAFVKHPGNDDIPTKAPAVTRPVWRYKFKVVPASIKMEEAFDILSKLNRAPRSSAKASGEGAFVLLASDWQIGKDTLEAGGGTEATIERLDRFFDLAVDRAKELRKQTDELVIWGLGDLVEGACIYSNQEYQTDRDRRQQINITATLLVDMIDRLSHLFKKVRVPVVGGNHGEQRINFKKVNRGSNDDMLVAEIAARELSRDKKSQHVSFILAGQKPALTIDIKGHIVGGTHGQVYGKGAGNTADLKAHNWMKSMALAREPIGDADILLAAHYHHLKIADFGKCLFVQNPASDGGSPEFTDYSGTANAPGMVSFVIKEENKFSHFELLG